MGRLPGLDPRILAAAGSTVVAADADPGAALDLDRTSSSRVLRAVRASADRAVMAAAAAVAAADCCADLPDALAAPASSLARAATAPTPAAAAADPPPLATVLPVPGGPARLLLPPTLPAGAGPDADTAPGVDAGALDPRPLCLAKMSFSSDSVAARASAPPATAPGRLAGLAPRPLCLAKISLSSESVAALALAPVPVPPEDDVRSATAPGLEAGRAPLPLCLARISCSRDVMEALAAEPDAAAAAPDAGAMPAGLPLPPGPEGLVGALPLTAVAPTAVPPPPPPPAAARLLASTSLSNESVAALPAPTATAPGWLARGWPAWLPAAPRLIRASRAAARSLRVCCGAVLPEEVEGAAAAEPADAPAWGGGGGCCPARDLRAAALDALPLLLLLSLLLSSLGMVERVMRCGIVSTIALLALIDDELDRINSTRETERMRDVPRFMPQHLFGATAKPKHFPLRKNEHMF